MKINKSQAIQYAFFLCIGAMLCWLFFKNINITELISDLKGRELSWFYAVIIITTLVYVVRCLRWKMLIESNNHQVTLLNLFAALSIGYFVNLVIPRLGEITRCLSIKKKHQIPFTELIGTVIIERAVDIISLIIFLLLTLLLQFNIIIEFVHQNIITPFYQTFSGKITSQKLIYTAIGILVILSLFYLFLKFKKRIKEKTPFFIQQFIEGLKHGLTSISKLKQKKIFIFYTALIWLGYYLMTYFWFFVFKDHTFLSWGVCLSIVAIGTIGRSVPIQGGGIGAYHFLVTGVVVLYGGNEAFGKSLATLIHAGQTLFTFFMGIIGLLIFYLNYWKKQ
jgi:uncharacterized protein (TIRG00374 family)